MDNVKKGTKIEVRERKNGRKVERYVVSEYPFEDTTYLDGTVIRSVLISMLAGPPLAVVAVAEHKTPKAAREAALAKAAELAAARGAEFNGKVE